MKVNTAAKHDEINVSHDKLQFLGHVEACMSLSIVPPPWRIDSEARITLALQRSFRAVCFSDELGLIRKGFDCWDNSLMAAILRFVLGEAVSAPLTSGCL